MIKTSLKKNPKRIIKPARPLSAVIGWREWVGLPDFGVQRIKAKIDTGAKTSSLHAFDVSVLKRQGQSIVRFKVHPLQRNTQRVVQCEAPLVEWRQVTDSGGKRTLRPVIETIITIAQRELVVEVTLIARDQMGFRMLIGRQALRKRWLVDPARSFLGSSHVELTIADQKRRQQAEEE